MVGVLFYKMWFYQVFHTPDPAPTTETKLVPKPGTVRKLLPHLNSISALNLMSSHISQHVHELPYEGT